jgi:hypothetical protein
MKFLFEKRNWHSSSHTVAFLLFGQSCMISCDAASMQALHFSFVM